MQGRCIRRRRSSALDKEGYVQTREHVLADGEARNVFTKNNMWKGTDFLRHVVGETEARGAITFPYACEHGNLVPAEDIVWWVSTNHGERRKRNSMSCWWCGACGQPCDWRKLDRLLTCISVKRHGKRAGGFSLHVER